jgi:hypothetical protein
VIEHVMSFNSFPELIFESCRPALLIPSIMTKHTGEDDAAVFHDR